MTPVVADPITVVVRIEAVELTGVAVTVDEVTVAGLATLGFQEI